VSGISVVGVPSSAASYAAGQDLAPAALRSAGLLEQLIASGLEVHDDGDLPHQAWSRHRSGQMVTRRMHMLGLGSGLPGRLCGETQQKVPARPSG
jgi:arginase family enzyme